MLFVIGHILVCLLCALILGALLALCLQSLMNAFFALRSEVDGLVHKLGDISTFARKSDVPDVSGFALRSELPDLSGMLKSAELPAKVGLFGFALRSELSKSPDLSGFALKTELPKLPDLSGFALKSELPGAPDLSGFAKKTDIPNQADLSPYALKSELPQIPDLSRFAEKTALPVVPDLSGFALKSEIPSITEMGEFAKTTDLPDISSLATISQIGQWKPALDERDITIASLQHSLAEEAARRAAEIERIEAMIKDHMNATQQEAVRPVETVPTAPAKPDNLKRIWGVGPVLEKRLHSLGVTTFHQIAHWTEADITRIEPLLDTIPDRIHREAWVRQCSTLH